MENFQTSVAMQRYMDEVKKQLEADTPIAILLNQKYSELMEQVPDDLKDRARQYLLLFGMMLEEAENDSEFKGQMFLPYKTMERLDKYLTNALCVHSEKNKNFFIRKGMIDSFTLLDLIKAYYALDDREEYEKELVEKEKAEKKKKALDEKLKKMRESAKDPIKTTNSTSTSGSTITKVVEKKESKKSNRDCNGQMDFFSMLLA